MVPLAPRYSPRLVAALRMLDNRRDPIAETCRRLGDVASELGLPRPSYSHVRRLVQAERLRQDAVLEVVGDVVNRSLAGLAVDPVLVLERLHEATPRR